jgi:hypothetical protein
MGNSVISSKNKALHIKDKPVSVHKNTKYLRKIKKINFHFSPIV